MTLHVSAGVLESFKNHTLLRICNCKLSIIIWLHPFFINGSFIIGIRNGALWSTVFIINNYILRTSDGKQIFLRLVTRSFIGMLFISLICPLYLNPSSVLHLSIYGAARPLLHFHFSFLHFTCKVLLHRVFYYSVSRFVFLYYFYSSVFLLSELCQTKCSPHQYLYVDFSCCAIWLLILRPL